RLILPRRPPSSTLLPYTTLFRSLRQPLAHLAGVLLVENEPSPLHFDYYLDERDLDLFVVLEEFRQPFEVLALEAIQPPSDVGILDRKSTRLNSSHVKISYAVFCL